MPDLVNINNIRNVDSKRITNKISFQIGEVFQARVMDASSSENELTLKTQDGWQFKADGKLPLEVLPEGLIKFKVVGYEDGKLQIVYVAPNNTETADEEKSLENIFKSQNIPFNKADLEIFKNMLQHGISLTKENISYIKNIVDFRDKIINEGENEDNFIEKYIQSKGLVADSQEAINVKTTLKEFFSQLKNVDLKDILTLKENGLELTSENLKSLNNIFKQDLSLYKQLVNTISKFEGREVKENSSNGKPQIIAEGEPILDSNIVIEKSELGNAADEFVARSTQKLTNESGEMAKTFKNTDKAIYDSLDHEIPIKEEVIDKPENFTRQVLNNESETIVNQEISPETKVLIDPKNIAKPEVLVKQENQKGNEELKNINSSKKIEKEIVDILVENKLPITKENVTLAKTILDLKLNVLKNPKIEEAVINKFVQAKVEELKVLQPSEETIKTVKNNITQVFENIKTTPTKDIIATLCKDDASESKPTKQFSELPQQKASITSKDSSEIKDNFQDKNVVVNTDSSQFKDIKNELPILKDIIKVILKNIEPKHEAENTKSSLLANEIRNEISQKTDIMKAIISTLQEGDLSSLKNTINDFKVFNTISNQYYYMDVPVNLSDKQYECKLLIKDDRKSGKKIDSENVKMIVSVKTINMGKVDAYIKVHNRNLIITIKCDEHWVKMFQKEQKQLVDLLQNMNYNVSYKAEKKNEEVSLVSTRDFFQDNTIGSINIMV